MVHFTGGRQRNKDHKRRIGELLNVGEKGLIFVVYMLSASQLITIDKKGVMSFSAVERAAGNNQCK